ncbi:hypothetical protein Y1Q_0009594 [Alligator mississippiensis]|uniref:Uncharacterized protein n=1 Tax=Alligator mississippiensis TaxID=8496 RepID=A0A151NUW6_ALLMI|nr:hypothetical protein Y1Q_0009594 [Alligator mississippiensis]
MKPKSDFCRLAGAKENCKSNQLSGKVTNNILHFCQAYRGQAGLTAGQTPTFLYSETFKTEEKQDTGMLNCNSCTQFYSKSHSLTVGLHVEAASQVPLYMLTCLVGMLHKESG